MTSLCNVEDKEEKKRELFTKVVAMDSGNSAAMTY